MITHTHKVRPACAAVVLSILALAPLTGCNTSPAPARVCEGVRLVSVNGATLYSQARTYYTGIRILDLQGKPLEQEMNNVMRLLDGAITNDPKCALFQTKMADMQMEAGQVQAAGSAYEQTRQLCEDWVPAWIGMAHVSTRKGDLDSARNYLRGATASLNQIQGAAKPLEDVPDFWSALGLNIPRQKQPDKSPNDPSLSDDESLQLLVNHLQESEAWTIENPGLLIQGQGGVSQVQPGKLFRRVHARIEYHYALIELQAGTGPDAVLAKLDRSLEWDPDFFPAKIEKAAQFRLSGKLQEAERLLRPYLDSADPKLSNNGRLLYEMAGIYTDWYVKEKDTQLADRADAYFSKLHTLNPKHAEGFVKRAELYLATGTALKRNDILDNAITCVNHARTIRGSDTPEATKLRADIAKAKAAIGS